MRVRAPKALLLDLDDTILNDSGNVDECWERACFSCQSELGHIQPATLLAAINRTRDWYWSDPERHRLGRLDLAAARREVVTIALRELGSYDARVAANIADRYARDRDDGLHVFPDAVDTVHWCRARGCQLALLTNGNAAMQRAKITRFGLEELFDAVLIEGELGFGKPNPRVYELALRQLDVDAVDTWMIGDNLEWDVVQPQKIGITGIWIDLKGTGVPDQLEIQPRFVVRALSEVRQLIELASSTPATGVQ